MLELLTRWENDDRRLRQIWAEASHTSQYMHVYGAACVDFPSPDARDQLELPLIMVSCYRNRIRHRVATGDANPSYPCHAV